MNRPPRRVEEKRSCGEQAALKKWLVGRGSDDFGSGFLGIRTGLLMKEGN